MCPGRKESKAFTRRDFVAGAAAASAVNEIFNFMFIPDPSPWYQIIPTKPEESWATPYTQQRTYCTLDLIA